MKVVFYGVINPYLSMDLFGGDPVVRDQNGNLTFLDRRLASREKRDLVELTEPVAFFDNAKAVSLSNLFLDLSGMKIEDIKDTYGALGWQKVVSLDKEAMNKDQAFYIAVVNEGLASKILSDCVKRLFVCYDKSFENKVTEIGNNLVNQRRLMIALCCICGSEFPQEMEQNEMLKKAFLVFGHANLMFGSDIRSIWKDSVRLMFPDWKYNDYLDQCKSYQSGN